MPSVWDLFRLQGRVAIVTGGAGKLGSQMCDALAEAGARVAVVSRDLDKCKTKAATLPSGFAVAADITNAESVRDMIQTVEAHYGRIDILVNNAYSGASRPFEEMTLEEFEAAWSGALSATFLVSQAAAKSMRARGSGNIINVSTIYGLVSPDQRIYGRSGLNSPCNYGAAKAGVIQFTRHLATYLAPDGIRVNCITPGGFYDVRFRDRPEYDEIFVRNYEARTPLGRMGNDTDLKGAVVYLASDASAYVTGHNLVVDGGWTVW